MKAFRDAASSVLRRWRRQKVITLTQLCQGLQTSVRTVRRRLKEWQALASFNHNSRFYTLPDLPQFDEHGLWFYRDIGFSRQGHLPQTIVAMITSNMARAGHPSRVVVRVDSESAKGSGLLMDSVIMTDNRATIQYTEIDRILGAFSGLREFDAALRTTLAL